MRIMTSISELSLSASLLRLSFGLMYINISIRSHQLLFSCLTNVEWAEWYDCRGSCSVNIVFLLGKYCIILFGLICDKNFLVCPQVSLPMHQTLKENFLKLHRQLKLILMCQYWPIQNITLKCCATVWNDFLFFGSESWIWSVCRHCRVEEFFWIINLKVN